MTKGRSGFAGHLFTLLAFVAVFVAWVGFILSESGTLPTLGEKYVIKAIVPSASLMTPGARVTVAGAEVGALKDIQRADDIGPNAQLTLEFTDDRVTPIPRDSTVQVRTRSQVGENFVAVVIGDDTRTVPNGGTLPLAQAEELVDVDQILSMMQGETRDRTRTLLAEFGGALTGRGDELNRTLSGFNGFAVHGGRLVDTLHTNRRTVAQLVDELGLVMSAVGDRGQAIETIATRGVYTLRALGDRDAELAATLRELPSTLDQVRRASRTVGDVSDRSAPVVSDLAVATRELRPAVIDLVPSAQSGRDLLDELDRATPAVRRVIAATDHTGPPLREAIPRLRTVFCQLNPMLDYLRPYTNDFLQIASHLGSASNAYDPTGHLIRLVPLVNEGSLSGASPEVLDAMDTLFASGLFVPQKVTSFEGFMPPGDIARAVANSNGEPDTPEEYGQGFDYPKVKADCRTGEPSDNL